MRHVVISQLGRHGQLDSVDSFASSKGNQSLGDCPSHWIDQSGKGSNLKVQSKIGMDKMDVS